MGTTSKDPDVDGHPLLVTKRSAGFLLQCEGMLFPLQGAVTLAHEEPGYPTVFSFVFYSGNVLIETQVILLFNLRQSINHQHKHNA